MPIRLAFFVDSMDVGGSELNAIRTLERIDHGRFDVVVYHMAKAGPLLSRYQALGVPLIHVPIRSFKHPSTLAAGLRLMRSLRRRRVQLLHAHDIYSNIFSVPFARLARTPGVIASKRWQYAVPSRMHVTANRIASRLATHVLANSEAVAESLRAEDRVPASKIRVIPNFVGPEAFEEFPSDAKRQLLSGLGIPFGSVVLGSVARLSTAKDHATLLTAAIPLCAEYPELHLLFVGDGPTRAALLAQIQAAGLADRVHLAGTLPNLPNPHGLLDISVLASTTEGFPNTVVEAMAAGRPVVATSVGGTPEALEQGVQGFLVPPGDPAALSDSLRTLLASPTQRSSFGTAGRARARTRYHADLVLDQLANWYASIAGGS